MDMCVRFLRIRGGPLVPSFFRVSTEAELQALRKVWTKLEREILRTRERRVGRHPAMMARPPSIKDQYNIVETATFRAL